MNKFKRLVIGILVALLIAAVPMNASAMYDSMHPPVITVVAMNAPRDMEITINIIKEDMIISVPMASQRLGWETCFRLYRDMVWEITAWYGNAYDLEGATLTVRCGNEEKLVPIPEEMLTVRGLDDVVTLHWKAGTVTAGLPGWRPPLLFALHLLGGLLVESLVFFLFGYRMRKSWLIFLAINLVSLSIWSWMIMDWLNVASTYLIWVILAEIVLFLAEILAFVLLQDEYDRDRAIVCSLVSNAVSLVAEVLMLTFLPV